MPNVDLPLPLEAYSGSAPYIFVSYAHADGTLVFPALRLLHEEGFRVWYDEGIDPGNEWPEAIAAALDRSDFFLVFISRAAVQSRNVRNEINYALNRRKPFLAIHLDATELPSGLELRMGDIQAILKWRMDEVPFRRKLLKTLPSSLRAPQTDTIQSIAGPPTATTQAPAAAPPSDPTSDQHSPRDPGLSEGKSEEALAPKRLAGGSLLHKASLPAGAAPSGRHSDLLTQAAENGKAETVQALLALDADVNGADKYGHTALLLAAKAGHTAVVQLLLDKGADVAIAVTRNAGGNGYTALHGAADAGSLDIFQSLISKGADVEARTEVGYSILMAAAAGKNADIVQMLLRLQPVSLNAKTTTGETALHYAFFRKPAKLQYYGGGPAAPNPPTAIPKLLILAGASVNVASWNHTPLSLAVQNEDVDAVRDLIAANANPNLVPRNPNARSPLTHAVWSSAQEQGDQELARLLLAAGADPDLKDDTGRTAKEYAAERGHTKSLLLLLANEK